MLKLMLAVLKLMPYSTGSHWSCWKGVDLKETSHNTGKEVLCFCSLQNVFLAVPSMHSRVEARASERTF